MARSEEWVSTGVAARLLGVRSVNTVKRLIRDGRLRAIRPGSHYRVSLDDVRRLGQLGAPAATPDPRQVPRDALSAWARRHRVKRVALFGSAARGTMDALSDVDVAIELQRDARVGLFEYVEMSDELADLFGRPVDLGTWASMRPRVRERAEREALTLQETR
jgi:excisionase family DNA binding protein